MQQDVSRRGKAVLVKTYIAHLISRIFDAHSAAIGRYEDEALQAVNGLRGLAKVLKDRNQLLIYNHRETMYYCRSKLDTFLKQMLNTIESEK